MPIALNSMQIGPEGTPGSEINATEIWRGPVADIEDLTKIVFVEEDIANLVRATGRTEKSVVGGQVSVPETALTFEQVVWFLQAGVEAIQSGSADGAGSGKIYTFDFGQTTKKTLKTLTVEVTNPTQDYLFTYGFCPQFSIRGEPNGLVQMAGMFRGRQKNSTTATASLSVATVHEAPFNLAALYLDAAGGTMGNTQKTLTLKGFSIDVSTGIIPDFYADGNLYFAQTNQVRAEFTVNVTFKINATWSTEYTAWLAGTTKLLEIKLEGDDLATAGDDYSKYTARLQFPGEWEKWNAWEDSDGLTVAAGTFRPGQNSTDGGPQIIIVNETSSYWS